MNLRESDLPGIGRKYCLDTRSGEKLVIVVHNDDRRDLFHMSPDDPDEVLSMVTLDDEEARTVSAIISGISYTPRLAENQEMALDGLIIEWLRIEPSSGCVGKRIGELDIRRNTGATILAVTEKNHRKTMNPGADYAFAAGSTLIVAGERKQLQQLKHLLTNGSL
ncbi:cation:proton antiporter regulatory subunit [Paenibacillus hemerocallicola]|uniref:cation:proton antiporter regulatory subunit n=1 Tax=Paenibacillus hemerocallicola TaxID=1172614 RepID=UPI001FEC24BE|nr:cation:proton antiporter regulatory subunit [Paenibacillus hemerocallicola]